MAEEDLIQKFKKKEETAFVGEGSNDKSKRKGNHHHTGNSSNAGRNRKTDKRWSNKNNQKRQEKKCYNCKEVGHFKKECPKLKDKNEQENEPEAEGEFREVAAIVADSNFSNGSDEWILDSGATEHMSYDRSTFVNYEKLNPHRRIRYGNDGEGRGIGMGDIPVQFISKDNRRKNLLLRNVLHVPEMKRKLMSSSAITENGNVGEIKRDSIEVKNNSGKVLFTAQKLGRLYRVSLEELISESDVAETDEPLKLWHERLCHLNKRAIVKMAANKSVEGLVEIDPKYKFSKGHASRIDCEVCSLAKMTKRFFPSSQRKRCERAGEVWHVDICGPIGTETFTGAKYVILFKDEHSNFRYIFFIKSREEVFGSIRRCIALVEFSGKQVKGIASDCGSEFMSKRTQALFLDKGIVHRTSAPFTPSQNGFIERDNRTLMEATRALLYSKNLPEKLWGEAANAVVHVLNRTINKNTACKTPYELYFGVKPNLSHIKVSGCLALVKA